MVKQNENSKDTVNHVPVKRNYKKITDTKREELLGYIHNDGMTIKIAAIKAGIEYENAKAINRVYVKQGRTLKKTVYANRTKT